MPIYQVMRAGQPSARNVSGGRLPIGLRVAFHRVAASALLAMLPLSGATAQVRPPPAPAPTGPPASQSPQPPQPPAEAPPPIDAAERALVEGRFDEVDRLAAEPDATVERRVMRARADVVRGRYDAALTALTSLAAADPGGDAAVARAELLQLLGRRDEAVAQWQGIVSSTEPERGAARLRRLARALPVLGGARRASGLFQEATALTPDDPRGHTEWGQLFLDKHNTKEAVELFAAALKADERWTPAWLGLARAVADDDPPSARAHVDRALALNPSSVEAYLIRADLNLDERKLEPARDDVEKALAINPSNLDAIAMKGALAFLEARPADVDRLAAQALAINPRDGDFYRIVGGQAAAHYRFEEAVALVTKGVELDPDSARVQAELGMHLLRTGDEAAARQALERAFKSDSYDVVTYNLLALLDSLDKFQTFTEGDLVLKLHPDEAPVVRESVTKLAQDAVASLSKRYGFTPKGPILIEMFPRHDDFAVRTLGLPGMVGALGACFGKVVTLDSPRARTPPGSFNWGATLWHELAHVMTLQLSAQRVPRWVTEGASVFEERRADASWGREGEHDFLVAYAKGELIKLAELNTGFSSSRTINLAYHQASLVVEHIVEKHGEAAFQKLLKAYGAGETQDAALLTGLGITVEQLQASFDQFLAARFGEARTALETVQDPFPAGNDDNPVAAVIAWADRHPRNYSIQLRAGRWLFEQERLDAARQHLERAASLVPQTMGDESPRMGLSEIAVKQNDPARAMRELELVIAEGHTAMEAARQLLALAQKNSDSERAGRAAVRIAALDPFDASAHAELGRLAVARQDSASAVRELELALRLGARDPAAAHTDLAEAYLQAGQPDAVRRHAIAALEIAPRYERAQELLLKVVDGR
jgi:cellulose synthase operon protein C